MARPITALTVYEIPGRHRGAVRVHRPAVGKSSYRVVWTDNDGKQRERTYPSEDVATTAAATLAESLAYAVRVGIPDALTFEHVLDHYLYGDGM